MHELKLTNDFVFKKVFGKKGNESILKSLLEAVLKIKITWIKVQTEVELERIMEEDKLGILDIIAVIDDNITVDIEMQMRDQFNMIERSLFYWAGLYHTGLQKNEKYIENKKAITINILNFDLFKEGPYHEKVELRRNFNNIKLTDKLEMHFIQLNKFIKKGKKEENIDLWNWLTFICNKDKEGVKMAIEENKEIKKAQEELEYLTGDEAVRRIAFLREKYERDYATNMSGARKEGIKEGIKEGLKEGERKKAIEIAKEMLAKKLDIDLIKEITKLSQEEIEKLISKK